MATLPIEYLRTTRLFKERIGDLEIISFEVPTHKYFSRNEIPYLATALDVDLRKLENMLSDMRYGRVAVEKLWAYRLDGDLIRESKKVLLPDLVANKDVDGEVEELEDTKILKIHVAKLKEFVRIFVKKRQGFREVIIYRKPPHPALIRYVAYL
ncbi:conserved hypothetical protein [Pyrobaculum islandicum DSM 4184]|uniref:Uncharacterized protein n=1 Tax=Pyrobaculum islandicum (strain DSM 4184 / JCM 9189 / GEO3) TaxID=384616 RepID=A1RTM0_PYRIL|nr:hypothetical protein [Pyrobaculum islandicum]ABL88302.1 conserved hypothetical protein [Pyrobaculum islandicum DSM 4184]